MRQSVYDPTIGQFAADEFFDTRLRDLVHARNTLNSLHCWISGGPSVPWKMLVHAEAHIDGQIEAILRSGESRWMKFQRKLGLI